MNYWTPQFSARDDGIPTALHLAGSPGATMGGVHIAAALDFRVLASSGTSPLIKEHLCYPGYFEPATGWDNVTAKPQGGVVGYPHFNPEGV